MSKTIALMLAVAAGLTMSTTAFAQSKDFDLAGFDRVDIATGLDARVTPGDRFSVRAQSRSQDALDSLDIRIDDGVLRARIEQNFLDFIISGGLVGLLLNSGNAVTIDITMPALTGVTASSGADVTVSGIHSERIDFDASSGANISATDAVLGQVTLTSSSGSGIEISGTADALEADASSGADIDAEDLTVANATVNASSGADVTLHATASVRADASSGGDIRVHGNPATRDVDTSSGGDVSFRR